ncbi:MAG: hypothetical protein ICV70_01310, partial [Jiangellaceae bacterium]|nr:hypothetical protein [Jiangellaceae bacterium]
MTESIPLAPSLWAAVSPDGQTLVTEDGLLLDLTSSTVQMPDRLSAVSGLSDGAVPRQAWADHGRAILVTGHTERGHVVRMVDSFAGVTLAEWTGVRAAAGDPTHAAAALEVLADDPVANWFDGFPLTERVEIGEATGMRTTVLTAVEFGAAVGITEFQRLVIDGLQFSPDGSLLALSGRTALAAPEEPSFGGFVVLARDGHVAYAQPAEVGAWWWLGWVDRRTLVAAFRETTRHPPRTGIISVSFSADGDPIMSRGVPLPDDAHAAASAWGACVVAPDERRLVCG